MLSKVLKPNHTLRASLRLLNKQSATQRSVFILSQRCFGNDMAQRAQAKQDGEGHAGAMGSMSHSQSMEDDTRTYWEIQDRTSLELEINDEKGSLFRLMEIFKQRSANLTSIQSRPKKQISEGKVVFF